jgi:predicted nucleotidyltransferase
MSSEQDRDNCELAIKKTLAYRSIFKYPVSKYQLKTYLITDKEFKNRIIDKSIEHLLHRGFIKEKNKKYFLPGIKPIEWHEKMVLTKKTIGKNEGILRLLGKIPWVNLLAVTGSVAAYNTKSDSDIDVLIISSKNRLWITRFFVTLILKITKKFPIIDGEKGKVCTNLFIDEKNLSWDLDKRNVFVAQDIVLMQPIVDKGNTYLKFLNNNKWISNYFAQFHVCTPGVNPTRNSFSSPVMDFIEKIFIKAQIFHMRKKQTTEITTQYLIHFNKNDNSQRILTSYKKVLENRKIT